MATIFTTILNMSLTASIIILVVLLARLVLKNSPKIYSYMLWAVVLFRLLCPVSFSLPVSVLAPVSEASTSTGSAYTGSMEYISMPQPAQPSVQNELPVQEEHAVDAAPNAPVQNSPAVAAPQQTERSAGEIVLIILGWIWAAGTVGVLGFTTWQTISLKRKLDTAFIIRGNIYESEKIDTAFILGVFNPKIYLPLNLPFDIQKAVVAHEQTHQRRGDHIVKFMAYIALAIHWFNPLAWLSFKLMCDDMEKSCDEAVLRAMNDRGYTMNSTKKAYGQMLLALGGGKQHIFSPVSFAENSTKSRVKNVVAYNRIARNMGIGLAVACALVVLLCVVNPTGTAAAVTGSGSADFLPPESNADITFVTVNGTAYRSDETELDLTGVNDLSFLAKFPMLERLKLLGVETEDYSALQYCRNLKHLDLTGNFESISFLEHCPQLESLRLQGGDVSDLSPILNCTGLKELEFLSLRRIDSYSPIGRLRNLNSLSLMLCKDFPSPESIEEINFSGMEQLEHLHFTNNGDLSFLKEIPNLRSLNTQIYTDADIGVIASLSGLEKLEFAAHYFSDQETMFDFTPLGKLEKLEYVNAYADDMWIKDHAADDEAALNYISSNLMQALPADSIRSLVLYGGYSITRESKQYLNRFTNLEKLIANLYENFSTLEFLNENKNLKELSFDGQNIHLYGIEGLSALESLKVNNVIDADCCSVIGNLHNLKELMVSIYFGGEDILDVSFLGKLSKLESLTLQVDYAINLSSISALTELKHLDLTTSLTDISWLSSMHKLEEVVLNEWIDSDGDAAEEETVIEAKIEQLDISSLSDKAGLRSLSLYGFLSDLSLLDNCNNLEYLAVYEFDERCAEVNDLYYAQFESFREKHPHCIISYLSNGDTAWY